MQIKHEFYASKVMSSVAKISDKNQLLYIYGNPYGLKNALSGTQNIWKHDNEYFFISKISRVDFPSSPTNNQYNEVSSLLNRNIRFDFRFKWNRFNNFLVNQLLESNAAIGFREIYAKYNSSFGRNISMATMMQLVEEFYTSVKDTELFLLRSNSVGILPKTTSRCLYVIL